MRTLILAMTLLVLVATLAYAAPMTAGTIKTLGGGTDTVAHCQVLDYDIAASDTITAVNANVVCDVTGSYTITATVTSGASNSSGQAAASLTANTPLVVAVTLGASVSISSSTYYADVHITK